MAYRISGIDPAPFRPLYGLDDAALARHGARRIMADAGPGFPDRIELRDARPGENVLLVNYLHQPAANAYRASHAIFVLEGSTQAATYIDGVPPALATRMLSLRAFDRSDEIVDAELIEGSVLGNAIAYMLGGEHVAYLHAHYARRGCFAARIDRWADN